MSYYTNYMISSLCYIIRHRSFEALEKLMILNRLNPQDGNDVAALQRMLKDELGTWGEIKSCPTEPKPQTVNPEPQTLSP